jgi:hypothetical protein
MKPSVQWRVIVYMCNYVHRQNYYKNLKETLITYECHSEWSTSSRSEEVRSEESVGTTTRS